MRYDMMEMRKRTSLARNGSSDRKEPHLKKGLYLLFAIVLATTAFAACGGDDEPTATPVSTPTAISTPDTTPTPTAMATPTATAMATATAMPADEMEDGMDHPMGCSPGGMLEDAATVFACNLQAMQQATSFSFAGEINLLAVFGGEAAGEEGLIRVGGTIVVPDKFSFTVSLTDQGQLVEMSGLLIGEDTYFQDPESGMWFKGTPPEAEFLGLVSQIGLLHLPTDADATLSETIDLDDGTRGYVLVSNQAGQGTGMEGLGFPGGTLIRVVGADDFLTRETRVAFAGLDDVERNIVTIRYSGYNETDEIEPPAQYMEIPDEMMLDPGMMEAAAVVELASNEDGNIEVTFSEPVFVEGEVELYVLDPETGGWGLPLLSGDGTDTFTFGAEAEDRPALIVGESQLAGFSFPTEDSNLVDSEGNWINLNFELWTYE